MSSSESPPACPADSCGSNLFVMKQRSSGPPLYECGFCGGNFVKTDNGVEEISFVERKELQSFEKEKLTPATDEEWDKIMAEFDTIFTPKRNKNNTTLHLPASEGPEKLMCDKTSGNSSKTLREAPLDSIPKRFMPVCMNCLSVWREE